MRISDWSSDVCSSDLVLYGTEGRGSLAYLKVEQHILKRHWQIPDPDLIIINHVRAQIGGDVIGRAASLNFAGSGSECACLCRCLRLRGSSREGDAELLEAQQGVRSEERRVGKEGV